MIHLKKYIYIKDYPIYNFFKEANIVFSCCDSIDCYESYKNDKLNCIIMDPPYLMCCNDFYSNRDVNIYEYLFKNDINIQNAFICLILEEIWIIKLLFHIDKYNIIFYNKIYQTNIRKTVHMIITNDL